MSVDNKSNRENLPAEFNGTQRNTQLANTNPFGIQLAGAPARMEEIRENEISLRDIWRLVLKHKWLLVTITIVGLILALLISLIRTPIYQASTTLQIGQRAPKVVQFENNSEQGQEGGDQRMNFATQIEILNSRNLAERVIADLNLGKQSVTQDVDPSTANDTDSESASADADAEKNGEAGFVARLQKRITVTFDKLSKPAQTSEDKINQEAVIASFKQSVRIEPVKNSNMVRVKVDNASPVLAALSGFKNRSPFPFPQLPYPFLLSHFG